MILILLLLSVVLMAFSFILTDKKILTLLSGLVFVGSISLVTLNFSHHFGMKPTTTIQEMELVSNSSQEKTLFYKPLGEGKEKIYFYQTETAGKTSSTAGENVQTKFTHQTEQTKLIIKRNEWVYKNGFYQLLFGIVGNNHEFISQQDHFALAKDWQVRAVK